MSPPIDSDSSLSEAEEPVRPARKRRGRAGRKPKRHPASPGSDPSGNSPRTLQEKAASLRAKTEKKVLQNRERKAKRRALKGTAPARRLHFVNISDTSFHVPDFKTEEAMHGTTGYTGRDDRGADFNLAYGSASEVLSRLEGFGYEVVDLDSP